MSLPEKQKSYIEELCKYPNNTLTSLIEKFSQLLSDGAIYIENRSVGFAFHISVDTDKTKVDDIKKENIGDLFYALSGLSETFLHNAEINKKLIEKMGLNVNLFDKIQFIREKLKESKVLTQIDYQIHSSGPRVIGGETSWNTKRLEFTNNSYPSADIVLTINHNRELKYVALELDKFNLQLLIKELTDIGKDLDNLLQVKTGESKQ